MTDSTVTNTSGIKPDHLTMEEWIESRIARFEGRKYDWNALKFQADFDPKYRRAQMRYIGTGAPNIFALLAKATHPRVSATAGGIFNGLGNFAGALSPAVMGALIAFTHSMDSGLIFLAVMAAVGCVLLLPLLRRY